MFPGFFFFKHFFILKTTNNQATPLLSKNKYRLRAEEMALSVSCLQNEHEDRSLDPNIHGKGLFVSSTGEAEAGKGQSGLEGELQVSQGYKQNTNQPNETKQQNQAMDA